MGTQRRPAQRRADDYYISPRWLIREFLNAWLKLDPRALEGDILDPCAGGCPEYPEMPYPAELRAVLHGHLPRVGIGSLSTNDLRNDSSAAYHLDFLTPNILDAFQSVMWSLIISNPPFRLAQEFVDRSLEILRPGGRVAFLLRLTFFGSQKRRDWWQATMPRYVFVHAKRPRLAPDIPSGNDSCDYAHVVWYKGDRRDHAEMRII